jgi:aldehyde dehydrogenase (NAD+)
LQENFVFDIVSEVSSHARESFFIHGDWVKPDGARRIPIVHPASEEALAEVPLADTNMVMRTIAAARTAFDKGPWPDLSGPTRAAYMCALTEELVKRLPLMAKLWTAQVGAPISLTQRIVRSGIDRLRFFTYLAATYELETQRRTAQGIARVHKVPKGVALLVVPWNATFPILCNKLGAALAAGCTCIIKSPPESPLDALMVAECAQAAGFPRGVINVLTADRDESALLAQSPLVDKISFTGSAAVGRQIGMGAAANFTRVTLELGGKSAAILLDDADLDRTLPALAPFTMPFAGQFCFGQTRLLVPRKRSQEITERFLAVVRQWKLGDPWDASTTMGPVLNQRQMDRVLGFIQGALRQGARLVTGGRRAPQFRRGFFIEPTVFADVAAHMDVAREEVFGPVVTIQAYDSDDDAVELANSTSFGLSGTVFSADPERAYRIARRVRTGQVGINHLELTPVAPFGGFKQSGIGREGGVEGLEEFLETQAILMAGPGRDRSSDQRDIGAAPAQLPQQAGLFQSSHSI